MLPSSLAWRNLLSASGEPSLFTRRQPTTSGASEEKQNTEFSVKICEIAALVPEKSNRNDAERLPTLLARESVLRPLPGVLKEEFQRLFDLLISAVINSIHLTDLLNFYQAQMRSNHSTAEYLQNEALSSV